MSEVLCKYCKQACWLTDSRCDKSYSGKYSFNLFIYKILNENQIYIYIIKQDIRIYIYMLRIAGQGAGPIFFVDIHGWLGGCQRLKNHFFGYFKKNPRATPGPSTSSK